MPPRPLYSVFLVHSDQERKASLFRAALERHVRSLGLDRARVTVRRGIPARLTDGTVAICLCLGSRAGATDNTCRASIARALGLGVPTFPVIEPNARFREIVPPDLHRFNALFWNGPDPPNRVALHALRSLGLTEAQRRVFISYLRRECLHIGEQLWELLSRSGFQVFLDRFSLAPGVNFQEKLLEALDDKSFLLLVESPNVMTSSWVEAEIQYARKRNMGLAVLTWPGARARGRLVPGIYEKYRQDIPAKWLRIDGHGQGRLAPPYLEQVVDIVEMRHAAALLRRRRELMGSLERALTANDVDFVGIADWSLAARSRRRGRTRDYLISLTPRPPDVPDLFVLDQLRARSAVRPLLRILVHTVRSLSQERGALLRWVIRQRGIQLVPEDQLVRLARRL